MTPDRKFAVARRPLLATLAIGTMMTETAEAQSPKLDPENTVFMDVKDGRVVIQLRPELAPKHVERVKILGFAPSCPFSMSMITS